MVVVYVRTNKGLLTDQDCTKIKERERGPILFWIPNRRQSIELQFAFVILSFTYKTELNILMRHQMMDPKKTAIHCYSIIYISKSNFIFFIFFWWDASFRDPTSSIFYKNMCLVVFNIIRKNRENNRKIAFMPKTHIYIQRNWHQIKK